MRPHDIILKLLPAAVLTAVAAACTVEVDLCGETTHPHSAEVSYSFDFGAGADAPDSMLVIANRVVARRVSAMAVSASTGCGRFVAGSTDSLFAAPEPAPGTPDGGTDTPDAGDTPAPDDEETPSGGTDATPGTDGDDGGDTPSGGTGSDIVVGAAAQSATRQTPDGDGGVAVTPGNEETGGGQTGAGADSRTFRLPVGTYRFMALNMDTTELVYDDVRRYLADGGDSIGMGSLNIEYRVYAKGEPGLRGTLIDWLDYNPYAGYIQPDVTAFCVGTNDVELSAGQRYDCKFSPNLMSQNVDVYFTIKKKEGSVPFVVDSVVGEISGLPWRINAVNGWLDISRTNKMMFRMGLVGAGDSPQADSYAATQVRCHANIDVPGIVPGSSTDVNTGPGIMQILIFTHADSPDAPGETLRKKIQGKINLFNTLRQARLTDYTDDLSYVRRTADHGVLDIKAELVIDGETIIENSDNTGGIDNWMPCDDIVVDI